MKRSSAQNVLVSTTPHLQGWEITQYHGAVSAHVVAGTNIFSDIAASWRDVFGGQSKSYKKQLEQINAKVVDELRQEASQRGANALVGLQIDHDQISGQNKEMFMVTASATAVRAESRSESSSTENEGTEEPITASEMGVEEKAVRLHKKHQNGTLKFNDKNWRFLIENQISDFAEIVQDTITDLLQRPGLSQDKKEHLNSSQDYFLSIPREKAKMCLYDMISHDERSVMNWAISVLEDGNILDLDQIGTMLEGEFYNEQKPALEVITRVDKPYYAPDDTERLKSLKTQIEHGFGKRAEILEVEESSMFSSDTKKVWQIKEGAHNPMHQDYCSETGLDVYGFGKTETRPEEAVQALETKIKALNRRFGGNDARS
jgi:uncharacterized protein YbjQ (UPF0145 family)